MYSKPDINCDMGEGAGNDALLMPFITSASIACGYHAGDADTMQQTVALALQHGVSIGAHPSFPDREHFGRREMALDDATLYRIITEQVKLLQEIAQAAGTSLRHVKPHGALYNMSAKDAGLAALVAQAVKDTDPALVLFGLSGSHSIRAAQAAGLKTASEAFADRSYQEDGSLTPRSQPGALIETTGEVVQQVRQIINRQQVTTLSGKIIPLQADTICIHGDGPHAVDFARAIFEAFIQPNA